MNVSFSQLSSDQLGLPVNRVRGDPAEFYKTCSTMAHELSVTFITTWFRYINKTQGTLTPPIKAALPFPDECHLGFHLKKRILMHILNIGIHQSSLSILC